MRPAFCAVALLALACLLPRAFRVGIAGDYMDPVSRITAQDEALYGHSAIAMARAGDWLTPKFLGRLALYKPPLLVWTAALSARTLGISRFTLRLPIAVLASLAVALIFLWAAEAAGPLAGICAVLLVLFNHLFHTLAALCMTDALLLAFTVAALYTLFYDPWLESRAALWTFAASSAAAILTKGIAGFFPLAVLAVYSLAARRDQRPTVARTAQALGLSLALAAPWFCYQLAVHPRWFMREHIAVEILGYGAGAPPQTSRESATVFYLLRLAATDPILLAASAVSLPGFLRELARRTAGPTLLACWLVLTIAVTLAWQYHSASYLLPLVPALAIVSTAYSPFARTKSHVWMLALLIAGLFLKLSAPSLPWGIGYGSGTVQPLSRDLSAYCESRRAGSLIIVDLADDLYATVLPIHTPRYATVSPTQAATPYGMPFAAMGIEVTVPQFNDLPRMEPTFRAYLREWGIDRADPVASLIVARTPEELADLVRAHPEADFLLSGRYSAALQTDTHDMLRAAAGYVFLLSRHSAHTNTPAWTCRM